MVINKDGIITENQDEPKNSNVFNYKIEEVSENNAVVDSGRCTIENLETDADEKSIDNLVIDSNKNSTDNFTLDATESPTVNFASSSSNISLDIKESSEEVAITSGANDEDVHSNCLALTVRKDYNLSIVKNSIFTTLRVSWKIAISTFILNILKLFL